MRTLVLFDIDGTLVRGGPAKEAFRVAMTEAFGTVRGIHVHDFAGKTDPQIARELLTAAGLSDGQVDRGFPRLWRRYLHELESRLGDRPMECLPGVRDLLEALRVHEDVALGLVTGNIAAGARLKLGSVGLAHRFAVGGYGSDHEDRARLPAVAIGRATERFGVAFEPKRVWVVGDTPRDVACGRQAGLRTLAVATGRFGEDALLRTGADRVFEDLACTANVLECVLDGG